MFSQTIQHLRGEVDAATIFHSALARVSQLADERAPTGWSGPLLDEIEEAVDEDGSYSHAMLAELRRKTAAALVSQLRVADTRISALGGARAANLRALLAATLAAGTGNTALGADPAQALGALVRSGELRLDHAQRSVQVVREGALAAAAPAQKPAPAKKAATKKKTPAKKATAKKPAVKKAVAKKPAAKKTAAKKPVKAKAVKKPAKARAGKR